MLVSNDIVKHPLVSEAKEIPPLVISEKQLMKHRLYFYERNLDTLSDIVGIKRVIDIYRILDSLDNGNDADEVFKFIALAIGEVSRVNRTSATVKKAVKEWEMEYKKRVFIEYFNTYFVKEDHEPKSPYINGNEHFNKLVSNFIPDIVFAVTEGNDYSQYVVTQLTNKLTGIDYRNGSIPEPTKVELSETVGTLQMYLIAFREVWNYEHISRELLNNNGLSNMISGLGQFICSWKDDL